MRQPYRSYMVDAEIALSQSVGWRRRLRMSAVGRAGTLGRAGERLVALARDPRLRARLGATGRLRVQKDFSVERWAPRLASLLRGESSTGA